ncbi:MAG: hypothetical protein FGM15_10290 [Chthoniobacterales bacterium]|nr:hypothetical protein [Chthoniobacterales bacterium]
MDPIAPDLQSVILCEDVRTEVSGSQSLVGVIGAIPAPQLPIGFFKLCLWTRWCGGIGKFHQDSRFLDPEDEVVAEAGIDFELREIEGSATNVHFFGGVQVKSFGVHHVEIRLDGDLRMRFPVPVVRVTHNPAGPPPFQTPAE